jgi:hypothetical protein
MAHTLTKTEQKVLRELQETIYQDLPLIKLVEKNYVDRGLSNEQIANTLYEMVIADKISVSEDTLSSCNQYDKLIVAHYEAAHKRNQK